MIADEASELNRPLLRNFAVLFCGLILIGSLGPFDFRGPWLGAKVGFFGMFHLTPHRVMHFSAFGILAAVLTLSGSRIRDRLFGLAMAISFGVLIEVLEFLSTTNKFEYWDVRDDALAAFLGFALAEAFLLAASAARSKPTL